MRQRHTTLLATFLILLFAATCGAASRINRSGYIAIGIDPILYESNLWETSHRISLDKFFTAKASDLGEALAEGLEKTAFRGQLRVLPGYKAEEQEEFRTKGSPDTFLVTVDIRSRYGLSESSPAAACLSGVSCFLLSPVKMFTYQSKTEANVTAFYFTPAGKRLRLVQDHFTSNGEVSGDFYDAMDMSQELEWITELTSRAIDDIRRQILAEIPTELVSRSWRKATDELNRPPAGRTAKPGLPPEPEIARTHVQVTEPVGTRANTGPEADQPRLNLQQILRRTSPAIFKIVTDRGTGSGFVISSRGFGVTSLHVVENAGRLRLRFHGGEEQPLRVVARHPDLDLAIISFRGARQAITLGDSDKVQVGEKVIALGYPLEVGLSVTPTSISKVEAYRGLPLIYIDTLVPPGNSGGPLLDSSGRVIGLIFRKQQKSASEGTTLALPINVARQKFEQFLDFTPTE